MSNGHVTTVSEPTQISLGRLSRPLVVDLDGTLLRSDLLIEGANAFVARHPFQFWRPLVWLLKGKVHLKTQLAQATDCNVATLPYNGKVLTWLQGEKAGGRRLILATASHRHLAEQVGDNLGIFDEVIATDRDRNMKGTTKRDALVARFGKRGFDYVGNDASDIEIWRDANEAWLVNPSSRLELRARKVANVRGVIQESAKNTLHALTKALRVHQWLKNLLVLVPVVTAHRITSIEDVWAATLAFVLFSVCASGAYVLNDVIDVDDDRKHPRKCLRPFASGELSLLTGWILSPLLVLTALAGAFFLLPLAFVAVLSGYYVLTLAYSFFLKRTVLLDVVTWAALYTLRLTAGAVAIAVAISFWLLAFSMFLFVSLAFIKRYTELRTTAEASPATRISGQGYYLTDRETVGVFGVSAGYLSVMVLALYIQDPATVSLYSHAQLIWLACPLLLYWISRVWLLARRGQMHDDPVVFAARDHVSWAVGALLVAIFAAAR